MRRITRVMLFAMSVAVPAVSQAEFTPLVDAEVVGYDSNALLFQPPATVVAQILSSKSAVTECSVNSYVGMGSPLSGVGYVGDIDYEVAADCVLTQENEGRSVTVQVTQLLLCEANSIAGGTCHQVSGAYLPPAANGFSGWATGSYRPALVDTNKSYIVMADVVITSPGVTFVGEPVPYSGGNLNGRPAGCIASAGKMDCLMVSVPFRYAP